MQTDKHVTELWLCLNDSGVVWFCDKTGKASSTNLSHLEFAANELCRNAQKIRILAFPQYSSLICDLYSSLVVEPEEQGQESEVVIELGSPLRCRQNNVTEPEEIFKNMSLLDGMSASLGGWHEMGPADFYSYFLTDCVRAGDMDNALDVLEYHPAYPAAYFAMGCSKKDVAEFLACIGDPRWYVDVSRPNRGAKLRSYLGLRSRIMEALLSEDEIGIHENRPHAYRAWRLLDAWTGGERIPPKLPDLDKPGNFLWRRYLEFPGDPVKGALRASAMYLSFVQAYWLDGVSQQELFVPEYFFVRDGDEVATVDRDGTTLEAYLRYDAFEPWRSD